MRIVTAREDAMLAARIAELEHDRDTLRAQNADLLATVLSLKAKGASDTTPLPRTTDRVSEVIADVAGSNHALRRQLGTWARAQRADKVDDAEILRGLLHWGEDDQGVAE